MCGRSPSGAPRADLDGNEKYLEGYIIPKDAAILFDFDSIWIPLLIFRDKQVQCNNK